MSLNAAKVAPEAAPGREAGQEPGPVAQGPEAGPGQDSESRPQPPAGPGSEPLPAAEPEPERVSASGPGRELELGWDAGQRAGAPPESQPLPASESENGVSERPRCHTDCLEVPLSRAFRRLGWEVGSHPPWIFLLLPMVLTAVLGAGLIHLPKEEEDLEEQYTPIGSPAKAERRFVQGHFTANESNLFSIARKSTEVSYASILVVSDTNSLLEQETLSEISEVDDAVQALTVTQAKGTQILYNEVHLKNQGYCVPSHPLLFAWKTKCPQPEKHHLPHLQPSRPGRVPGQHPWRNCVRREHGTEPVTPGGQSHAAAVLPEDWRRRGQRTQQGVADPLPEPSWQP